MDTYVKSELEKQHDLIWDIATRVKRYVPGVIGWIAHQRDDEFDDLWGFVIGRGFAAIRASEAEHADEATIRELATQILGFPPDSPEDYERRIKEAQEHITQLSNSIHDLEGNLTYWNGCLKHAQLKLAERKNAAQSED